MSIAEKSAGYMSAALESNVIARTSEGKQLASRTSEPVVLIVFSDKVTINYRV
jgi:hypothetical protein